MIDPRSRLVPIALILAFIAGPVCAEIEHIGLYMSFAGRPEVQRFVKACGYNTYEVADWGWNTPIADHGEYYRALAKDIAQAQQDGFYVTVLLLSNMNQREETPFADVLAMTFTPVDTEKMAQRLGYIREAVRQLKTADGFVFFAADPGGDEERQSTVNHFIEMTKAVQGIVQEETPEAEYFLNTWAVAAWDQFPSPFENTFWLKEVSITKEILARPEMAGAEMNVVFPLHNYYRSLALRTYADAGTDPERYPSAAEVKVLRERGAKDLWGWPYFLIDEIDDGYSGATYRQTQAETRYLHSVVNDARRIGLNGLIGNLSEGGHYAEVLNTYAFARFCKDPSATPAEILREFAGLIAEPESVEILADVLAYIENNSSWEAGMPEKYRLSPLDAGTLNVPAEALSLLEKVKALDESAFPLPEAPPAYLERLKARITFLRDRKEGE